MCNSLTATFISSQLWELAAAAALPGPFSELPHGSPRGRVRGRRRHRQLQACEPVRQAAVDLLAVDVAIQLPMGIHEM